jgi:HK97 family phage portal protein
MGLIDKLFGLDKKAVVPVNTISSALINNGVAVYANDNPMAQVDRYVSIDDIYSIVRLIAKTSATIPIRVYRKIDQRKAADYDRLTKTKQWTAQSYVSKMMLKAMALEEVNGLDPLYQLLNNPNPLYTVNEFREGFHTMRLTTGNGYIYAPKIEMGVNTGKVAEMWLLPSQYTTPRVVASFPRQVTGYTLSLLGQINLPTDEVLHSRYFNPEFTTEGSELVGLSPLRALNRASARARSENDFMVRGFQNAGAQGIVSVKGMEDISVEALGKLKSEFYTESSGTLNARKNLFMGNEVTFTQIGLSPVDMQVIESQKYTFKRICNAYGVSDVLFNNGEAATESNVNAMIKRLYTNAALPEVYAYRDLLNQSIVPLFGPDYYVDVDLVGITELQDDMKAMADIFSTLPIMQPNMILEAFNYGKSDDIMMDQFYIKAGYEPIANMAPIPDLPISPDYGQPATNR